MLVIISDLHLTDGTSGETISSSAFRMFKNRLSDMAYDASWRDDPDSELGEKYVPVRELNLLLLGDVLDMIRSERWNKALEEIMPWTDKRHNAFFEKIDEIVDAILECNKLSFAVLKGIADDDLQIPESMEPATEEQKKNRKIKFVASAKRISLKVNIYYMIGNHDWFFYIEDERMNVIRNKVIDALGLANERNKPFPHSIEEKSATATAIRDLQTAHRVYAKHGDEFDKTNFQVPHRDVSSIGDVVVIKLLNEIPNKIKESLEKRRTASDAPEEIETFISQLREIDNLRPYSLAPAWITQVLRETTLDRRIVNQSIKEALRSVIKKFRGNRLVSKNFGLNYGMKLAELLISGNFNIETISMLVSKLGITKDKFELYKKYALVMAANRETDFLVMGHTHYPEVVPISTYIDSSGTKRQKIYINTGTWRSLHKTGLQDKSFISYKTITLAGFFLPEERKGRSFEFWTGSLAI